MSAPAEYEEEEEAEEEEEESSEEEIDQTVYRAPAAARLPAEVLLRRMPPGVVGMEEEEQEEEEQQQEGEEGKGEEGKGAEGKSEEGEEGKDDEVGGEDGDAAAVAAAATPPAAAVMAAAAEEEPEDCVRVPSDAMGELLAAYNSLRAFSWQLRLSPFSFQDFAAAMCAPHVRRSEAGGWLGGRADWAPSQPARPPPAGVHGALCCTHPTPTFLPPPPPTPVLALSPRCWARRCTCACCER